MFTPTKTILEKAHKGNYAVPHFNINTLDTLQGVVMAAEKLKSPIIIATSEGGIKFAGMEELFCMAYTSSRVRTCPMALHLDHGRDLKIIRQAIKRGYSSVMIDASHEKFEKNVQLTKKVVQWAHAKGISVEAELGTIGGAEDTVSSRTILYTDPDAAKEFVHKTGCDFLAIAIGTSHGAYKFKGSTKLRVDLVAKIKQKTKIPLVLHGASGVPAAIVRQAEKYGAQLSGVQGVPNHQIQQAIRNGINKINTDTDLRLAFDAAVRKELKTKPKDFDPRHILNPARELIQKVAEERIKLFGSKGKA